MPRNGNGDYSLPKPAFVPNTTISSSDVNSDFSDIADALTASIAANGETPITAPLKFPSGSSALPAFSFESEPGTGMYFVSTGILGFSGDGADAVHFDSTVIGTGKDGNIFKYANGAIPSPVGRGADFFTSVIPSGWLLMYGQAVSRTGYPELFQVIGTTFGSGDGSTTFNLPDLRGRTTYGIDNMGGSAANRITVAGGNFDATVLGGVGGGQNQTLTSAQQASMTVSVNSSTPTVTSISVDNSFNAAQGTGFIYHPYTVVSPTSGTLTSTGTASGGGGSHTILSPGMAVNKCIFAGRP